MLSPHLPRSKKTLPYLSIPLGQPSSDGTPVMDPSGLEPPRMPVSERTWGSSRSSRICRWILWANLDLNGFILEWNVGKLTRSAGLP
jgi:hypothetical protein